MVLRLLATMLLSSCSGPICIGGTGLTVAIYDADTKDEICDANVTITDGEKQRWHWEGPRHVIPEEQCLYAPNNTTGGRYDVKVSKDGYDSQTFSDIAAEALGCTESRLNVLLSRRSE